MLETVQSYGEQGQQAVLDWITSPAAYAQFGLLLVAYLAALIVSARLQPKLAELLKSDSESSGAR